MLYLYLYLVGLGISLGYYITHRGAHFYSWRLALFCGCLCWPIFGTAILLSAASSTIKEWPVWDKLDSWWWNESEETKGE